MALQQKCERPRVKNPPFWCFFKAGDFLGVLLTFKRCIMNLLTSPGRNGMQHQSILPILGGILQPEGYDPGDALVMEVYSRDRCESTFGGPGSS